MTNDLPAPATAASHSPIASGDTSPVASGKATPVVGRFAPSPSGRMHLGNAVAALLAWLGARSAGGRMVLRIEDIDPRSRHRDHALTLMDDLRWLGIDWDEGPYWQTERTHHYQEALDLLGQAGLTYPCFCTRAQIHAASAPHESDGTYVYQGACRNLTPQQVAEKSRLRHPATRLVVPDAQSADGTVRFDDLVFGPHEERLARDCGDFVVSRSDGIAAYQLAVVVDDGLMGVTQVVRGRDLLGSTARQIYLMGLLGFEVPQYAHVPLVVAPDGRRLSKRDRDLDLGALRAAGTPPQRVAGWIAHATGLTDDFCETDASDLVDAFSWERLRTHHEDIVVDEAALSLLRYT